MTVKNVIKTISKSDGFRKVLCWVVAQFIRLTYTTSRWNVINGEIPQKFWDEDKPFILAFWHGRIFMMPYCWNRKKTVHMLISQHRDGQLIARTVGHLGVQTIAGSSSKGGASALRTMLKTLKGGESIGITPDGPRGPRMRASGGVINIAKMSGVPIIPCAVGVKKRKHVKSWDRFMIAWPFNKGVFVWGDPIEIAKDTSKDDLLVLQDQLEHTLTDLTNKVDELTGNPPVEPAPKAQEEAA